jgi:peptide deformylase
MFAVNFVDFLDPKQPKYLWTVINPEIIGKSVEMVYLPGGEGCLSVERPTTGLVTPRHYAITVRFQTYDFVTKKIKTIKKTLEGYPAIVFQHEYDHLDGVLYTDKMYNIEDLEDVYPLFEYEEDEE